VNSCADDGRGPSLRFRAPAAGLRHAVILALALAVSVQSLGAGVVEIGEPAPVLKGRLFSGEAFDLARLRGKVVLVNFYSSYCKFCAYEIGTLEAFYEAHREDGLQVIAVGIDAPDDRGRVERMLGIYSLPGTMADELTESGFARRYPTPTAFVIDRAGIVRHKISGAKSPAHYRELVLPLLRE
jgi:cytochrome c biogenesis protein CcmG, thiol:disulfide interchange protein DsbE